MNATSLGIVLPEALEELRPEDFEFFRKAARERAGIALSTQKWVLVQSRLRSRLGPNGLTSFCEYRQLLETLPSDHPEWEAFVNQITTNKTEWFREPAHFEYLRRKFLPEWKTLGRPRLRVWCAACSTGEEPYTLAIVLENELAREGFDYEIYASDLDTDVLAYARNGVYPREKVRNQVPAEEFGRSFVAGTAEIADWVKIRDALRNRIRYHQVNLDRIPTVLPGTDGTTEKFDLVFCRNVFIYFDASTIESAVREFAKRTTPEAFLFISHSETLSRTIPDWKVEKPSIYRRRR